MSVDFKILIHIARISMLLFFKCMSLSSLDIFAEINPTNIGSIFMERQRLNILKSIIFVTNFMIIVFLLPIIYDI